jgi:tetratricopeptide (TPR) repeat protein
LLTDACHSGAIFPSASSQAFNNRLQNLSASIFSLTASRDREKSLEGVRWGGGHGAFTYYVIQGLQGQADSDDNGEITADELQEYVRANVRRSTDQQQNPTSERGSFDPNMLLAYDPTRRRPPVPSDALRFGTLVIETNMDGVELLLDGKSQGIVNTGQPKQLPGITPGVHILQGTHIGYEPYGPEDAIVYPGQSTTIRVRITVVRRHKKAAADLFEKGWKLYRDGGKQNYLDAAELFERALQIDPNHSRAALYLARTYNALFDAEKANQLFRRSIEIDPDYLEARESYAGSLLDEGDFRTAIRELNAVVQRDLDDGIAHYMLCVAFTRIGADDKKIGWALSG